MAEYKFEDRPTANSVALKEITDLQLFVELCWEGLGYPSLASLIHEKFSRFIRKAEDKPTPERLDRLKILEEFAAEQSKNGFPYLHALAVVRLCTIIEVFIQDIIVWTLSNIPEVKDFPILKKLKGPLIEFASAPHQKQSEYITNLLYDDLSVRLKRGIGRFEDVLNSIELGGPVNEKIKKLIIELYEIRNIVAHKNAVVDERFVNNCPWMETTVGEPINLSREQFSYYFLAVSWYVNEVSRRHLLRYPPEDPSKFSSQESINKLLQSMLDRLKNYAG
jgi:hypothetical protein